LLSQIFHIFGKLENLFWINFNFNMMMLLKHKMLIKN